ncbi:AAA family ATPase [Streptomyces sp. NPDC046881]|uniref:helix-turn-helix transcriptional regulator n=1 Tax=Streptomyces sp. NPDC046881 TaxID=3155374 RepID=UPI0033E22FFF
MMSKPGDFFVGRRSELDELSRCALQAQQGRPWLVWVCGESGAGKTTLLRHWLGHGEAQAFRVLTARCASSEQEFPYGLVEQLLRKVPPSLLQGSFLEHGTVPEDAAPFRVGAQLLEVLGLLQSQSSVAMVVDDVQWADRNSKAALGFVLRRLEADTVITILSLRGASGERIEDARDPLIEEGVERVCRVSLSGFSAEEVSHLAEHSLDRVDSHTVENLVNLTRGNPLYVRMLIREIERTSAASHPGNAEFSPSLTSVISHQLANVPQASRRLAEALAVLSGHIPLLKAAAVAEVSEPSIAMEPLLAEGLVEWIRADPAAPVAIRHELQKSAIYACLSPVRRKELHVRAAAVLPRDASWEHRVAAADSVNGALSHELEEAANEQLHRGNVNRAATLWLWAADVASSCTEHDRLLQLAAAHLLWIDEFSRVKPLLVDIQACAPSPMRDLILGAYAESRGRLNEAAPLLTNALDAEERSTAPERVKIAGMAASWLGLLELLRGDGTAAVKAFERVPSINDADSAITYRAKSHLAFAHAFIHGPRAGLNSLTDFLESDGDAHHFLSFPLMFRGLLHSFAGEFNAGIRDVSQALDMSRLSGRPTMDEFGFVCLSSVQFLLGKWDESSVSARNALIISSKREKPWAAAMGHAALSFTFSGRGDFVQAQEHLDIAQTELGRFAPSWAVPFTHLGNAVLAHAQSDTKRLLAILEPLTRPPLAGPASHFEVWWRALYTEALIENGRSSEAETELRHVQDLARTAPYLRLPAAWLHGKYVESCGDKHGAMNIYQSTVTRARDPDDSLVYMALIQRSLGGCLKSIGRVSDGDLWIGRGEGTLSTLGARPYVASASKMHESDLLAGLTPRERDIAHLVGRGMTNREVGAELFVSAKTVEYHLGHIFTKLGMTSRRQLRDLIFDPPRVLRSPTSGDEPVG